MMSLSLGRGKQKQLSLWKRENRDSSSLHQFFCLLSEDVRFSLGEGSDHWCLHWVVFSLPPSFSSGHHIPQMLFFTIRESRSKPQTLNPNLRLKGPQVVGHKTKGGRQRNDRIRVWDFFVFSFFFVWVGRMLVFSILTMFFFFFSFPIVFLPSSPLCSHYVHQVPISFTSCCQ